MIFNIGGDFMSTVSKLYDLIPVKSVKILYLAAPLIVGLSACSVSKNFVFTNGPRDLEYKFYIDNINNVGNNDISTKITKSIVEANKQYLDSKIVSDSVITSDSIVVPNYYFMPTKH
jgi:hypothetical protein